MGFRTAKIRINCDYSAVVCCSHVAVAVLMCCLLSIPEFSLAAEQTNLQTDMQGSTQVSLMASNPEQSLEIRAEASPVLQTPNERVLDDSSVELPVVGVCSVVNDYLNAACAQNPHYSGCEP